MAHIFKQKILSIIPLYISKECPAFNELQKTIEDIPDEKFTQAINHQSLSVNERVNHLLDEIIFFVNEHYSINHQEGVQLDHMINEIKRILIDLMCSNQTMATKISSLENRIELLEYEKKERRKLRVTAEILTPIVKEIRNTMINEHIPDCYYSRTIINACLLRLNGENISWEVSDFDRNNPQTRFDLNILNRFESIIKDHAHTLRINSQTLLELLHIKFDRNEFEHDTIKNFLRSNSNGNLSFNAYLTFSGIADVFSVNEKICLDILYRIYFLNYYSIQ